VEVAQSVECLITDWTTEVRSLTEAKMFPLASVQTSSDTHPASYPIILLEGRNDPSGNSRNVDIEIQTLVYKL
jgi:hypothetical protein